jgi:hypothetical protein
MAQSNMEVVFAGENMKSKLLEEIKLTVLRHQESLSNGGIAFLM